MSSDDKNTRHTTRMVRKKAVIDAAIEQANQEKGLLLVLTGNGKGKSSSAFGMMARALGYGMKVGVAQFIKGRSDTGEEAFFRGQANVEWRDPDIKLVILDELTYTIKYGYLDITQILADIAGRPAMQHVVVTGRGAPAALTDMADTVSEIMDVKHAWRAGIKAQPGIDL
jgi:cob(I)alamin adenosyltransferase